MIILNLLYRNNSLSTHTLFKWLGRNKITNLQLLFDAIYKHDIELVNYLLSRQDVVDLIRHNYDKKNILVDIWKNINKKDDIVFRNGRSTGLYEILFRHEIIKKYINKSFDTMLIACDNLKLFKLFLTNGLNCNLTDKYGNTILHHMCKYNKLYVGNVDRRECVRYIIVSINCNIVNKYGNTALHEACKSNNINSVEIAKLILDNSNIDISIKNLKNETAIEYAFINKQTDILRIMFNKNMSLLNEYINKSFDTMLTVCDDLKLFKLFSTGGLNYELTDKCGNTILHHMCRSNKLYINDDDYWSCVKNTVMSTDCNITNKYGNTALHEACKSNNMNTIEVAKLILNNSDIDILIKNLKNETAVGYAYTNNQINILRLMHDRDISRSDESERNIVTQYKINNSSNTMTKKTSESNIDIMEAERLCFSIYSKRFITRRILELPPA